MIVPGLSLSALATGDGHLGVAATAFVEGFAVGAAVWGSAACGTCGSLAGDH
jgi:hypothetical protein